MANNVRVKIMLPEMVFRDVNVDKVQVPLKDKNYTLLSERAPTVFALHIGLIQLLDEKNDVIEKFFIKSGVVDFAKGYCRILLDHITEYDAITIAQAKAAREEAVKDDEKAYYEFVETTLMMDKK
ncbi:MAG: hypothetical protein PHE89_04630 [Alphaproteobacteria bacterium]|nr:hypothetical protein [Alphaproteobacteria bacterium]